MAKARTKAVWGVDLGHAGLKAMKLALGSDGEVQLVGHDYIEHGKILSQPEADPPQLIAKSLEKFISRNDITEDQVVISVPGQHTLARFSKLPPVDKKKIPDIVQFEANQQIPFDLDEVIWDYQIFGELDSPEIEVGIFAMKRELIHEHLAHYSDVGIEPVLVQVAPLALFDAMLFDGYCSEETTVLVDVGAENTDLIITDRVRIWTRTIPIGGNNFTDALVTGFKLSFSKAENLKRQASSSKYARQIFQAMRPVFAELVGEIQRSVGFYSSTHREAKLDRLVAAGNAFKLPGLQKYLQQNLGLSVIRPTEFKQLKAAAEAPKEFREQVLSLGVAYGLALQGLSKGALDINLLPTEIARQIVWRKKKPWFAAAAACLLIGAAAVWGRQAADQRSLAAGGQGGVRSMKYESAEATFRRGIPNNLPPRQYAQTCLQMAKALTGRYDQLKNKDSDKEEASQSVLDLLRYKGLWPRVLNAIHASLPRPQAALASATSGASFVTAVLADPDGLARPYRRQVFIESLRSHYVDNVFALDYRPEEIRAADREELFTYYGQNGLDGFLITLSCRTPHHEKGKFVQNHFLPGLRERGQQPDRDFYFDGVRLVGGPEAPRAAATRPSGRPGRGGRRHLSSSSGAERKRSGGVDPLTFEDTSEDFRFVVRFVVVLDSLPAEETPGTPEPPKEGKGRRGGGR